MTKFLVGLSMLLLGGYVSVQTHPNESTENLLEQTVQITIFNKPLFQGTEEYRYNYGGICAGVWIGNKHVLTASHCVENSKVLPDEKDQPTLTALYEIYLDTQDNKDNSYYLAKLQRVAVKSDCDLAILRIISPLEGEHPVVQLRESNLVVGEPVATIGHPGRFAWVYTSGQVSALNKTLDDERFSNIININIGHGNSGGGLFDADNKLVGIAQAISESGDERLSVYSTQACIKSIINETKVKETKKKRTW